MTDGNLTSPLGHSAKDAVGRPLVVEEVCDGERVVVVVASG